MKLPFLLSVPHAGLAIPPELEDRSILSASEIAHDGDEGAAEIYDLETEVREFQKASIARAFVDLNRAEDDIWRDGVVKTHTCWNVPIYRRPLPEDVTETLLEKYHRPYHRSLEEIGKRGEVRLAIDCHTMAAFGPPVGPDPGVERPWICLGFADGTCPRPWAEALRDSFQERLDGPVTINEPFRGGYITRHHSAEMPWVQVEMSRAGFMTNAEKKRLVAGVLAAFASSVFHS